MEDTPLNVRQAQKKTRLMLYTALSQEQLKRTRMPLGMYTKEEVRALAEKAGLPVANKPDQYGNLFYS